MSGINVNQPQKTYSRYLVPYYGGGGVSTVSQATTAGRVHALQFGVEKPATVDRIIYTVGSASAGNVTVGIYRVVTPGTLTGATLVVQSSSTAVASANTIQPITITNTTLAPGSYYVAFEFSSASASFTRFANVAVDTGLTSYFDQTYGTLPSTAPTATEDNNSLAVPMSRIRVVQ